MKDTKYIYFVSYSHRHGFGNIEIEQNFEMSAFSEIKSAQKVIEEKGAISPVILSFQLLTTK